MMVYAGNFSFDRSRIFIVFVSIPGPIFSAKVKTPHP